MSGYTTDFTPSGMGHNRGTVPDPGGTAGTSRFLREDAVWIVPGGHPPVPPPPPPGPAQNQWACDIAGYLTYEVVRLAAKRALDLLPVTWFADVVAGVLVGVVQALLPEGAPLEAPFAGIVHDWIQNWIQTYITDWTAQIVDDVLWAKVHCQIYDAILLTPSAIQTALTAAGTAIAALTGYPTGVLQGIEYLLGQLGVTGPFGVPFTALEHNYDCSTCATTGVGPTKPLLQTTFDLTVSDGTAKDTFVDTLTLARGTLSGTSPTPTWTPNTATSTTVGMAQPDDTTIQIDGSGILSVIAGALATVNLLQLGSVAATASSGVTISGLVVGATYALQSTGGPWSYAAGAGHDAYSWSMSVDGGATFQTVWLEATGFTSALTTPSWAITAEKTDANHARVVWVATATSVIFRAQDTFYPDNTGTLGWQLLGVQYEGSSALYEHGGVGVATRPSLNFVDGGGVTWSIADNALDDRVDVSATTSGGTVTGVTGTAPITSTGGAAPAIGLTTPLATQYGGTGLDTSGVGEGDILVGQSGHTWVRGGIGGGAGISVTELGGVFTISASGSGGGGTAMTLLFDAIVGTGGAPSIAYSSIPNTYRGLWVRYLAQYEGSGTGVADLVVSLGNGTYLVSTLSSSNSSVSGGHTSGTNSGPIGVVDGHGLGANVFASGEIWLYDYVTTANYKNLLSKNVYHNGALDAGHIVLYDAAMTVEIAAAISSLTFTNDSGQNFAVNTRFTVYGLS